MNFVDDNTWVTTLIKKFPFGTYRTSAISSPASILFFHFQSPLLLSKIRVLFKVGYYLRSYGISIMKLKLLFCSSVRSSSPEII